MAAILGILLLGATITGMVYLASGRASQSKGQAWKRDAAYKERPVDQYVTVSMS